MIATKVILLRFSEVSFVLHRIADIRIDIMYSIGVVPFDEFQKGIVSFVILIHINHSVITTVYTKICLFCEFQFPFRFPFRSSIQEIRLIEAKMNRGSIRIYRLFQKRYLLRDQSMKCIPFLFDFVHFDCFCRATSETKMCFRSF